VAGTTTRIAIGMGLLLCAALGGLAGATVTVAPLDDLPPSAPGPKCTKAAATKTFGMTEWEVFGCDDDRTLFIVSAEGNPASPFYFTVYPENGEYHVFGEGTGDRQATDAAFKEIELFTSADIRALMDEAKSAQTP
jgi:hypothetical protein